MNDTPQPTPALSLRFVIPDHPWVDTANNAAVRIAMTVAGFAKGPGELWTVVDESPIENGEMLVKTTVEVGHIQPDLRTGAKVSSAVALLSNSGICWQGCKLVGSGFQVMTVDEPYFAGADAPSRTLLRRYWTGSDITRRRAERSVIDTYGIGEEQLRRDFPTAYQWLHDRVWPERSQNRDPGFRNNWWLFGRPRPELRSACKGLERFIVTSEVSKHRIFTSLSWPMDLVDGSITAIATSDALVLGVLSSSLHIAWALAGGGTLEDRPRYQNGPCFDNFPFPHEDTGLKSELSKCIATTAEQLDAHRKTRQAAHPELTLTGMYNVLEKLRLAQPLTAKDKLIHTQGLVSVLKTLHDDLDAAVLQAYGWQDLQPALADHTQAEARAAAVDTLLERLVALNTKRAAEEATGTVRWLRPDFQQRGTAAAQERMDIDTEEEAGAAEPAAADSPATTAVPKRPWPAGLPAQIKAVADVLSSTPRALSLGDLEQRFAARGRWRDRLPTIVETLEALGRARRADGSCTEARWQSA